jgi:oligopeptidase A
MPSRFDNSALIRDILALRQEEARLLGYVNFGEVSVVPKMAESPQEVITLPARPRSKKARPYAEKDVADLRAFAARASGPARIRKPGIGPTSARS